MSAAIHNREFQHPTDGWYQIEAKGYHPAISDSGEKIVQVIDDRAIQSIVNRFNQKANAGTLLNGHEMLIDHEHFSHDKSKETVAYGWAKKLRVSPDGSGFDTEKPWTATGQKSVDGGDYRFFSTEYGGNSDSIFEKVSANEIPSNIRNKYAGYSFLRPLELTGLSLTNCNNNKGQKAITIANRSTPNPISTKGANEGMTPGTPSEGLAAWFAAVEQMRHELQKSSYKVSISFQQAWDYCRAENPDLFTAAFGSQAGDDNEDDDSGEAGSDAATKQVADIANRIKLAVKMDYRFGWNFVQENLPAIFNRMLPRTARVMNRTASEPDSVTIQKQAAQLFNRLTNAEQRVSGVTGSHAWQLVTTREQILAALASGQLTPDAAFAQEPELRSRLIGS